jgi:putative ABC transport system permease protein
MDTYADAFGKKADIKTALVQLKNGPAAAIREKSGAENVLSDEEIRASATEAAGYEHTAAVSVTMDVRESVAKMMESLDMVVYVVILSAALLAFIVLYNLTNINITERIREIATIKVLGFNQLEVSQYVFRENMFLTAIAAVVGIPLGKWLLAYCIDNIVVKMIYFEPRITNMNILTAVALTFAFAAFVNLAMQRRLRNVSMTESLKSVE